MPVKHDPPTPIPFTTPLVNQLWTTTKPVKYFQTEENSTVHTKGKNNNKLKQLSLPKCFRIIALTSTRIYIIDMKNTLAHPQDIDIKKFKELIQSGNIVLHPDSTQYFRGDATESMTREMQDRLDIIDDSMMTTSAITDKSYRNKIINKIEKKLGTTRNTAISIMNRFWQSGFLPDSLYPDYRGRGRKKDSTSANSLTPEQRTSIENYLWEHYAVYNPPTILAAYDNYCASSHNTSDNYYLDKTPDIKDIIKSDCPTKSQFLGCFNHWLDNNYEKIVKLTNGAIKYHLQFRDYLGRNDYPPIAPGSLYFIDSTRVDYGIVDAHNRARYIGRPYLTLCTDVSTRMIVGFWLGMSSESNISLTMTLINTMTDKTIYCKHYGRPITHEQWPVHHLCNCLTTDNGSSYKSILSDTICRKLGISCVTLPVKYADYKGQIEHMFYTVDNHFGNLPGRVDPDDGHYEQTAKLTLEELRLLVIDFIIRFNRSTAVVKAPLPEMIGQDYDPTPIGLWKWGIENQGGCLRYVDPKALHTWLLPTAEGLIKKNGLKFKNLIYSNEDIRKNKSWFVKARSRRRISQSSGSTYKVTIYYDPADAGQVYYYDYTDKQLHTFTLIENQDYCYHGLSFDEVRIEQNRVNQLLKNQQIISQADKLASIKYREAILSKANKAARAARKLHGDMDTKNRTAYVNQALIWDLDDALNYIKKLSTWNTV